MPEYYEKFKQIQLDKTCISLEEPSYTVDYFCYPVNAKAIGYEGCIMYCFIEGYGEMVFASNPETCADIHVYPLAYDFKDLLRLILACGSVNPAEQVIWMSKEGFDEHLKNEKDVMREEQMKWLEIICNEFELEPMENPYEYVKAVQRGFDSSKIIYSDEYYDVLGIER